MSLEQTAQAIFKSWFVDFDPCGRRRRDGSRMAWMQPPPPYFRVLLVSQTLGRTCRMGHDEHGELWPTLKYGKSLRDYTSTSGAYPVYGRPMARLECALSRFAPLPESLLDGRGLTEVSTIRRCYFL